MEKQTITFEEFESKFFRYIKSNPFNHCGTYMSELDMSNWFLDFVGENIDVWFSSDVDETTPLDKRDLYQWIKRSIVDFQIINICAADQWNIDQDEIADEEMYARDEILNVVRNILDEQL